MKQYKVTIFTISKGFKEETYLLKDDVLELINKKIKENKKYIKIQKRFLKLKEMSNKEWIKGRIGETENTLYMLKELRLKLSGENKK